MVYSRHEKSDHCMLQFCICTELFKLVDIQRNCVLQREEIIYNLAATKKNRQPPRFNAFGDTLTYRIYFIWLYYQMNDVKSFSLAREAGKAYPPLFVKIFGLVDGEEAETIWLHP